MPQDGRSRRAPRRSPRARGPRAPKPPEPQRLRTTLPTEVAEDVRATARAGRASDVLRLLEQAVDGIERGRIRQAVKAATEAKGLAPRSAAARETLGLALYRAERYREALRELQAYRRMTGRSDQNHLIADCHRALGAPEKALALVREALGAPIAPAVKAEAVVVGASALADQGRFEEALTLLRRFPAPTGGARPHDLRVWYVTADVLERSGRPHDAAREFRKILRHDPGAFDVAERLTALS